MWLPVHDFIISFIAFFIYVYVISDLVYGPFLVSYITTHVLFDSVLPDPLYLLLLAISLVMLPIL